jgi:hypothetical protein
MNRFACLPVAALVLLLSGSSRGEEIYRWVDAEGEVHYTNDSEAIPREHRKKADKTSGAELGEVSGDGNPAYDSEAVRGESPDARAAAAEKKQADEQRWRKAFGELHERIRALETALAADRKVQADPGGHGIAIQYGADGMVRPSAEFLALEERLRSNERDLARARERLHDLEVQASREAVPREWRR